MKRSEFMHEIPLVSDNLAKLLHNVQNGVSAGVISLSCNIELSDSHYIIPTPRKILVSRKNSLREMVHEFIAANAESLIREDSLLMVSRHGNVYVVSEMQLFRVESKAELPMLHKLSKARGGVGVLDNRGNRVIISKLKEA